MKRTRTGATLILSAALMAATVGTASAHIGTQDEDAIKLPGSICEGLNELLSENGTFDVGIHGASIDFEVVSRVFAFDPIQPWLAATSVDVFTCSVSAPISDRSDIATTP